MVFLSDMNWKARVIAWSCYFGSLGVVALFAILIWAIVVAYNQARGEGGAPRPLPLWRGGGAIIRHLDSCERCAGEAGHLRCEDLSAKVARVRAIAAHAMRQKGFEADGN